jgi:hypothetical protein
MRRHGRRTTAQVYVGLRKKNEKKKEQQRVETDKIHKVYG